MKKKLAAAILSAVMIGSPLTTKASSSFFADVPANDWSYSAVNELIATGNVTGYDEPVPEGRILSRIEMAMIVDNAQRNLSAFSNSDKAVIERLSKEYYYDIEIDTNGKDDLYRFETDLLF